MSFFSRLSCVSWAKIFINMQDTLYFGDLHFHTHYSDNRDLASIEAMLLTGTRHNLSIFGTADHNHNLNAEKWQRTQTETEHLKIKYPDLVLFNNCEITFLIGHFNVLAPERIEGTIAEGYRYLYQEPAALKIINHPFECNDEWYKRIIPDASGIEVINGSVFKHAQERGFRISSAMNIPSVQVYATYLALNFPVAAIGGSDAHRKSELGYGMTGFRFDHRPDTQAVITAIREYRTFATTLYGIVLDWSFESETGIISWQIDWNKEPSASHHGVIVEIYCGDQKVHTTADKAGVFSAEQAGLYWIAVFDEYDIAVSSPIAAFSELTPRPPLFGREGEQEEVGGISGFLPLSSQERGPGGEFSLQDDHVNILTNALRYIRQDLTWLSQDALSRAQSLSPTFKQEAEIPIISASDTPRIVDRYGYAVPYEVIHHNAPRVIIDKECDFRGFDEFYVWFERNELHEYAFVDIEYRKIGDAFEFRGLLLPKKMVHDKSIAARYRNEGEKIRSLLDEQTLCKVYVATLPALIVKIQLDSSRLPYRICHVFPGLDSVFVYVDDDVACPAHISQYVNRMLPAWADADETGRGFQEHIYQLFVCAEDEHETL